MKHKRNGKRYIYMRDDGACYFCGKKLLFKQISLDHYLPKSKSGPNDLFNLVCSCRRCNKYKKSSVPEDYKEVLLELFKKAIEDGEITSVGIKKKDLISLTKEVYGLEIIGEYSVFQSISNRLYVKNNKIARIVKVKTNIKDEEW